MTGWEDLPFEAPDNGRISAFVSISRGCNKNCTFCIVPVTRGPEVSRDPEEVYREIRVAVHRGAKEVVLLGQTVNSYGRDLNPRLKFTDLLAEISEIEGLERIRFTSPHPQEVRSDFVDLVCENEKVCRHIHLPLQSGSDRILKAMNRNYRRKRYLEIVDQLRSRVPDMALTTDIIVGFPGETEEDLQQTLEIMNYAQFENSYSFMYSPRPGTPASEMEENTNKREKLERLQRVQSLQQSLAAVRLNRWVGKEVELLIDGPSHSDPSCLQGRMSQNIRVNLLRPAPGIEPGMVVQARIESAARYTLRGELSDRPY